MICKRCVFVFLDLLLRKHHGTILLRFDNAGPTSSKGLLFALSRGHESRYVSCVVARD